MISGKIKWFLGVFGVCLLYWLIDSVWSYFSFEVNLRSLIFSEPRTLNDTLLLRTTPYQVASRLTLTALIIAGGWLLYKYIYMIKSSEQRTRASEERFRSFSEQSLVGIYLIKNGFFTYINPKAAEVFGYSVEECLDNMPLSRVVHPEDLALANEQIRRRTSGEVQSLQYEIRGVKKDGRIIHLEVYGSILREQGGILAIGTLLDITDRKLAEEALKKSEERNRQILHMAMDGFWRVDAQGRLLEVNEAYCRITGYSEEELMAMKVSDLDTDDGPEKNAIRLKQIRERGSGRFTSRHRRKDGRIIDIEVSAHHTPGEGEGEFAGFLRDITEQKRMESQLRQVQKMEALGTLTGGIAHDFNNILSAVLGFAEIAHKGVVDGSAAPADIEQIIKASLRAKKLVSQILTFSRKNEPTLQPFDMNKACREAQSILEHTIPKMIAIEFDLGNNLPCISADPNQMEQVLLNLCSNAADAMPNGGQLVLATKVVETDTVFHKLHPEVPPGEYVLFSVSDTGCGMNQEIREHIFDPFFTTKEVGSGTGLGLSTVYGIIKNHNGFVYCYSEPGQGTTFSIYLPVTSKRQLEGRAEELAGSVAATTGTETILFVDDEDALRTIGVGVLQEAGYRVLEASSGEEALQIYSEQPEPPDLVITDLGMPGMGGHKAMLEILARYPDAKFVIASGYAAQAQVKVSLEAGAAAYVAKPFRLSELLDTTRKVLDGN